jgi:hypothetical protein
MGNYLGYKNTEGSLDVLVNQEQVPESPIVSPEKLDTIREYFLSNALEGPLRPTNAPSDIETSALFDPVERDILPNEVAYGRREVVTLVEVAEDPPRLFVGEGNENMLLEYREPDTDDAKSALELIRAVQFDTQPVEIETAGDTLTVTLIGDLIKGRKKGQVVRLSPGEGQLKATHLVQDHYRTPHACLHDLNASGRKDLVEKTSWLQGSGISARDDCPGSRTWGTIGTRSTFCGSKMERLRPLYMTSTGMVGRTLWLSSHKHGRSWWSI